jgi:GDP-4-dehydro-6-deoxy-D-mannose reductase
MSSKIVLVTGATGFIGRRLVERLKEAGHRVLELSSEHGDIVDPSTLASFDTAGLDFVFHLAGRTFVPESWLEPAEFKRVNVKGTANVLELCRRCKLPLTFVSAYLYGVPASLPIKETDRVEPNNPYALSKFLAEAVCRYYAQHFDVPVTIIRPFNVFGLGQKEYFLIPEILAQVQAKKPIQLNDLKPRRDYLYLDDMIEALLCTLEVRSGCRLYNIGSGSSLSVAEIVDAVQALTGTSLPVVNKNVKRQNEILDAYADICRAQDELGWRPRHSFAEGIMKIVSIEGA